MKYLRCHCFIKDGTLNYLFAAPYTHRGVGFFLVSGLMSTFFAAELACNVFSTDRTQLGFMFHYGLLKKGRGYPFEFGCKLGLLPKFFDSFPVLLSRFHEYDEC